MVDPGLLQGIFGLTVTARHKSQGAAEQVEPEVDATTHLHYQPIEALVPEHDSPFSP